MGWCNYYKKKVDGRQSIYCPKHTTNKQCYTCKWYSKELKKKPFSDLNEEEYIKRYKTLKTFYKTGK